jgi:trehalose 6-phosphate synthase
VILVSRIALLANRLPVASPAGGDGEWQESPGGVASVLRVVARTVDTVWIGCLDSPATTAPSHWYGTPLVAISAPNAESQRLAAEFANQTLWPLYHNVTDGELRTAQPLWDAFTNTNMSFAAAALSTGCDTFWVNDYQLQLAPQMIRAGSVGVRIGFCYYIPFPPADRFVQLAHWRQILSGVLGADVIGFQTDRDRLRFLDVAARLHPVTAVTVSVGGRSVRVGTFPCSIDTARVEAVARSGQTARRAASLREHWGNPRLVISSAERLDYTKGVDRRLAVLHEMFRAGALDAAAVAVVQVAEPTRLAIPAYRSYAELVRDRVAQINAEFPAAPIKYYHRRFDGYAMSALYRATDIMAVTPRCDGMNLVAKEYVASRVDGGGALVLSRGAGCAVELADAYLIDPDDDRSAERAILAALGEFGDGARMRRMRATVTTNDVYRWIASYLAALSA